MPSSDNFIRDKMSSGKNERFFLSRNIPLFIDIYFSKRGKSSGNEEYLKRIYLEEFFIKESELLKEIIRNLSHLKYTVKDLKKNQNYGIHENKLLNLDPIEFEHFVAKYFEKKGYKTELTSPSNDGGIDIFLSNDRNENIAVQCKRYVGHVSAPEMRGFLGTLVYNDIGKGFFVTSGRFSPNAMKIASEHNIELIDGDMISEEYLSEFSKKKGKLNTDKLEEINRLKNQQLTCFFTKNASDDSGYNEILRKKLSEYDKYLDRLPHYDFILSYIQGLRDFTISVIRDELDEIIESPELRKKLDGKSQTYSGGGVTEGQQKMLNKYFVNKDKISKFKLLNERYRDTNLRKVLWKENNKVLSRGDVSYLLNEYLKKRADEND